MPKEKPEQPEVSGPAIPVPVEIDPLATGVGPDVDNEDGDD